MQNLSLLLFLTIIPVILISVWIYHKDKEKEPLVLLLVLFLLGILSCFLVLKVSDLLRYVFPFMSMSTKEMDFLSLLLYSFIGIALVEEVCKWIMVFFFGYHHKEFEEPYDIIVYAVFVALGFAFYENFAYVFSLGNVKTAFLRAIAAVPGHACYAISMGYYLSLAKRFHYKGRKDLERNNIYLSVLIPTVLHGVYDFCLMLGLKVFIYIFVVFVIYLYYTSIKKVLEVAKKNGAMQKKQVYCPSCGHKMENNFCNTCGKRQ